MIRFSLVIQNENGEFLLCKTADTSEQKRYEFPGGKLETDILPPFETFLEHIHDTMLKSMSIDICDIERIELYLREEPFFVHTVFSARITSGIPTAIGYSNVCWVSVDKIDMDSLNIYGLQVIQKIKECGYCQLLYKRREEIDSFFKNYFSKAEENITILDALDVTNSNHSLYMIAFKQEMVHLRASLIENVKLKKNITIQNYFQLYGRMDLAEKVDQLLQLKVKENLTLRELIKVTVDKFIAHYDNPSEKDKEIYDYCVSIFDVNGKLPLKEFVNLLNGYIMSLITQMWYDAGELGVSMSERCYEDQKIIVDYGDDLLSKMVTALSDDSKSDKKKSAVTEVVAALIWDNNKFMICQRPEHKARALLWEFVGGKVEPGETKEQALIRECQEELAVTLTVGDVFMDIVHEYPDITVHLTLFNAAIAEGIPQKLEHNDIKWITVLEIDDYDFCPADTELLDEIKIQFKR